MSRQIEQALLSLMPTYNSDPPASLVELAGSLLAQSRFRASALRPEEEVARLYACANIACESLSGRLKISLDLPPIQPRPPIPPRHYKNLLSHLQSVLPNAATSRTSTPSKARKFVDSPDPNLPSRQTPSKAESLAPFQTPSKRGRPRKVKAANGDGDVKDQLHPWIRPVIKFLCAETSMEQLAPTMLAGMETIVVPGGRRSEDEWTSQNISSLLAAIFVLVKSHGDRITSSDITKTRLNDPERKAILDTLSRCRDEILIPNVPEEEAWQDWDTVTPKDLDAAIEQVKARDWLQEDWFKGIVDILHREPISNANGPDADAADSTLGPIRRADTMFQDKYDFLSEARRSDYAVWKEKMLCRIADQRNATAEMDTS